MNLFQYKTIYLFKEIYTFTEIYTNYTKIIQIFKKILSIMIQILPHETVIM